MVPLTHQEEVVIADGVRLRRGRLFDGTSGRSFIAALLEETRDALRAGASGVVYGRRLWQADDPAKLAAAVRAIIHQEGSG
jgi:DhnA family fructose-bisphosphate aldolase class Ia